MTDDTTETATDIKTDRSTRKRSRRKRLVILAILLAILTGAGIYRKNLFKYLGGSGAPAIPAIEVERSDFVDYVELRGEIAVGSASVVKAPYGAGNLQILKLVPNGTKVRKGDAVVSFDPTNLKRDADQYRAALRQADAEVERVRAQQRLQEEQSKTDVVSAEFGLEVARLDASTRDVVPAIESEKNLLAVAKAEQKMRELDAKLASSRAAAEADMARFLRQRDKAREDLEQVERNMAELVLKSPGDGVISLLPNSQARTSILSGSSPTFKEGDRAYSGATIAELPDMTTIYAAAPVYESDRGRVEVGQPVVMRVEAVPDRDHLGVVGEISTLAGIDTSSVPVRKSFDLKVQMEQPDPRLRAGMTATIRVEVERIPDAVVIPSEAVFERGGHLVVYVLEGSRYRERQVRLSRRNGSQVMIASGLEPGERIATQDPTLEESAD
ncbi:MAG: efflux RND transporter periplasmic adaptor subunit [Acidobacteriota bacterium]|jgi:RND family efflux transporter MFP subunit|nr:efflux RND transporter periplasmic adaptor subunit [Acidobacteriota bacterium]